MRIERLPGGLQPRQVFEPPPGHRLATLAFCTAYPAFEKFMRHWHPDGARDPVAGRCGWWKNSNAQWDFWLVGHRFAGRLKSRPGHGSIANPPEAKPGWVNRIRRADLNLDATEADARTAAAGLHDRLGAAIGMQEARAMQPPAAFQARHPRTTGQPTSPTMTSRRNACSRTSWPRQV